jgi:hypothetical protein
MSNLPTPARIQAIAAIVQPIAAQHLDAEYQRLVGVALEQLAQQLHSALDGKAAGWAGGILWALFEHNLYHGAPHPVGQALQTWCEVSAGTLRHRRREVSHLLGLADDEGLARYMHAELYDALAQATSTSAPLALAGHADLTADQHAARSAQFDQALHQLLQQSVNGVDMAEVEALAAQFGLTVQLSEP